MKTKLMAGSSLVIETILDFIRSKSPHFQRYINHHYLDTNEDALLLVAPKHLVDCVYNLNGKKFNITKCMGLLDDVVVEYKYCDIKKDDVVVDIGANIGGFSIAVHDKCNHVYAVEPLFVTELRSNVELNNAKNITILPCGLGVGYIDLEYKGKSKNVECFSLSDIKYKVGGKIDFLKMDCEGGEWCIEPDELSDIRRIEMELHIFNKENKDMFLQILNTAGFDYDIESRPINSQTFLIHAINTRSDKL